MSILELKGITYFYNGKKVLDIPALTIEKGRMYGVVGPNGSGKTTLLSIMSLILRPTSGEVYFEGRQIQHDSKSFVIARGFMTMTLQNPYLFNTSVAKNAAYGLRSKGIPKKDRHAKVTEVLDLVGLNGFEKRRAKELSGGEIQLAALARALILDPKILFLDEPTASLDPRHVDRFERIIARINSEQGITVVMTSHNLSRAYRLTESVFSLFEGSLMDSTMDNLFSGRILKTPEGPCFDTGAIRIWILPGSHPIDATHAIIDPENIIASKEPFASSARNQFKGIVTEIVDQGGRILLGVQAEENFKVLITDLSLLKMGLNPGSEVYLTFKASSVKLL